jgi:hypothetical protein
MERLTRNAPALLLAAAAAAAALITLVLSAKLTFYADTWELLMSRRDPSLDTLLDPHNEHLIALPVLFEQIILRLFGMTSAMPEYVLLTAILITTAVLLYVYVKRRMGPWPALFAAVLLLFLGPAWEALLWPFEIAFCGPMLFGLAMLLALEREDRAGDLAACAFLTVALAFSSLGVPFVFAAFVAVLQGPRSTWLRRAYVFAVPALLFAAWYLGWGHDAQSHLGLRNLLASPRAVADAIAAPLASLVGLGASPVGIVPSAGWGQALLVALVGLLVFRQLRKPGFFPGLWPVAAAAAASWGLTAVNLAPGRDPTASRYQYAGAIFVLLLLANLLQGSRWSRGAIVAGAVVTVLAVSTNLVVLEDGRDYLDGQTQLARAGTAAIEIASRTVDPDFQLTPERAGTPVLVDVSAARYLQAVDEYGSPAYSVDELAAASAAARRQADIVLAQALPLATATLPGGYAASASAGCQAIEPGGGGEVPLGPGTTRIEVPPGPAAELSLRRFAGDEYPVRAGSAPGDSTTALKIPADSAPQPWQLQVDADQGARICP